MLERSSAQGTHVEDYDDDDVEEISTVQQRSEDEGPSEKAATPDSVSRPPTGSLRGYCLCFLQIFLLSVDAFLLFPAEQKHIQ